jgi:hypothetical protein
MVGYWASSLGASYFLFLVKIYYTILISLFPFPICSSYVISHIRMQFYKVVNSRQVISRLESDLLLHKTSVCSIVLHGTGNTDFPRKS